MLDSDYHFCFSFSLFSWCLLAVFRFVSSGSCSEFIDPGSEHRIRYQHDVVTGSLNQSTTYYYRVGSKQQNGKTKTTTNTLHTTQQEQTIHITICKKSESI